jgi:eukaryotic-like serine/threonine-protein kinase
MTSNTLRAKGTSDRPTVPPGAVEEPSDAVAGSSGMTYRPIQELGAGAMTRSVLAHGAGAGGFSKIVVLKMLHQQLADDPLAREMFEGEARLSARLNHPNLVQVYEVVDAEIPFVVMEYLHGKALSRVSSGGAITQAMLLTIIAEALVGLHHAHELCDFDGTPLHIVHREMNPDHVFVTYDGAVKVLDFGIGKTAGSASFAATSEVKGKAAYMAPEQLLEQKVDRRADIFAVGCMLWEVAVGNWIWGEMSDSAVMHRLATGEIPRPDGRTGMDPRLEQIVLKATATAADERYQTALDLQHDLTEYIAQRWQPGSLRNIGAALAETFKDEREENQKLIGSALSGSSATIGDSWKRSKSGALTAGAVRPSPRRWVVLAAAAVLMMLAGVSLGLRSKAGPIAASRPTPQRAALVHIQVRAAPPEAVVEIDGRDRGPTPVALSVTADEQSHSIRASAPGYLPEVRILDFSRDLEVDIALQKLAPTAERTPIGTPAASASSRYEAPRRVFVVAPKPKGAASAEESQCTPPYYFTNGIKTFKPECL